MKFTVLSHACMYVEAVDSSLLIDPWLFGSCYWRSWWNYPEPPRELIEHLEPSFIYLTHIHWDHFHGVSLRKFKKTTPIIIPKDRYLRMRQDLHAMGFKNILEAPHAKKLSLSPTLSISSYHFSPMTDSAIVIESSGVTLLNANDCKIAGVPLKQILNRHPRIDFAFRSHSSANVRACHYYLDTRESMADEKDQYLISFYNFIRAVKPTCAVPFASNHCHLHKDTFHFNTLIQTPDRVRNFFEHHAKLDGLETKLCIMLPGDSWDSDKGFDTGRFRTKNPFEDRMEQLRRYQERNAEKLEKYYSYENAVAVGISDMEQFGKGFFSAIPWIMRFPLRGVDIGIASISERGEKYFQWNVYSKGISEIGKPEFEQLSIQVVFPPLVLKQALRLNMFAHAGISKRVKYFAVAQSTRKLEYFESLLSHYEYQLIPLRNLLSWRCITSYLRRWREVVLYLQVLILKARGNRITNIEQMLLKKLF